MAHVCSSRCSQTAQLLKLEDEQNCLETSTCWKALPLSSLHPSPPAFPVYFRSNDWYSLCPYTFPTGLLALSHPVRSSDMLVLGFTQESSLYTGSWLVITVLWVWQTDITFSVFCDTDICWKLLNSCFLWTLPTLNLGCCLPSPTPKGTICYDTKPYSLVRGMVIDLSNIKCIRWGEMPKNEKIENLQVGAPWRQVDQVLCCSLYIPVLMKESSFGWI